MKLKQIQLQGFKSFVDRTVINFTDQITGVVGPNGCGKSNLVDAVRWALGEQSSKNLRGGSMEDVIFHGTDEAQSVGMAEVTIIFDNTSGECPPEYASYSEIQVTRRLFREGHSEYSINKEPCRLKDVVDLFLGSGMGTRAYSIIEQGKIDSIITMKPEQRRILIEEAAGVSKYRIRRQEAMRKMDATRNNLVRIRDIIAELKRQMNSLNRQAKKAERYKRYRSELKQLEMELACFKALGIKQEKEKQSSKVGHLSDREMELATAIEKAEASLEEMKAELVQAERTLSNQQNRTMEAAREVEKHDRALAMLDQERITIERRVERLRREQEELAEREKSVLAEIEGLKNEGQTLESGIQNTDQSLEEANHTRQEAVARYRELLEATNVLEKHALSIKASLEKLNDRLEWSDRRLSELKNSKENLINRKDKIESNLEDQARTNLAYNEKLYRLRKEAEELRKDIEARQGWLEESHKKFAVAEDRLKNVSSDLTQKTLRLENLKEMEANFEGYQRGVKAIMERREKLAAMGQNGTYGLIAEVVKTAPQYELALEAVLGDRIQTIFVKDIKHGLDNIDYLRQTGEGRSAFAPIEGSSVRPETPHESLLAIGAEPLVSRIEANEKFAPVVKAMVGDALVVPNLEQAAQVRAEVGATNPLVTFDGILMDRLGVIAGGSEDSFAGVLAKKREIEELTTTVQSLQATHDKAGEETVLLNNEIKELAASLSELNDKSHRMEIDKNNVEKDLRQGANAYNAMREEIKALEDDLAKIDKDFENIVNEGKNAKEEAERDRESGKNIEEDLVSRRKALDKLRLERDEHGRICTEIQVKAASLREKLTAQQRHQERLGRAVEELHQNARLRVVDMEDNCKRLEALTKEMEEARGRKEKAVLFAKQVEDEASQSRDAYEKQATKLREAEADQKKTYKERNDLREERMNLELSVTQLKLQWEGLEENVTDKFGRELGSIVGEFQEVAGADDFPAQQKRDVREDLKRKLERMGDVNPTAIEEFEEISERHSFLSNQEADLITALENLEVTIGKINSAYKRSFKKTFDQVNEYFQQVFPKLFNGGKASLVLTDPDNVLESGVEIMAQPPGKKMNSIALLSGGEKALTSSGLILSLFLVRPSPFCLLDEVDAALDDVNVDRFNTMLKDLSGQSQLILITHNKRTMELADTLYGVTMEHKGMSKLVSVKLNRAVEMVDDAAAHP
jgi:chromosome segregation protein